MLPAAVAGVVGTTAYVFYCFLQYFPFVKTYAIWGKLILLAARVKYCSLFDLVRSIRHACSLAHQRCPNDLSVIMKAPVDR